MAVTSYTTEHLVNASGGTCKCMCGTSADKKTRVACGKTAIKGKEYCSDCEDHYGMEF